MASIILNDLDGFAKSKMEELRESHGFTHREMAEKLNMKGVASYYSVEQGNARITLTHVADFCKIFRLSPSEFFGEEHIADHVAEVVEGEHKDLYTEIMGSPDKLNALLSLYRRISDDDGTVLGFLSDILAVKG